RPHRERRARHAAILRPARGRAEHAREPFRPDVSAAAPELADAHGDGEGLCASAPRRLDSTQHSSRAADTVLVERHRYTPDDPDYPRRLYQLDDPPSFTATGPLHPAKAVAIVGSRGALAETLDFARGLARLLAERGVTIVSGGAKGVDTAAHRGALD